MIQIKPYLKNNFNCPVCSQKSRVNEIQIKSAFTVADCLCEKCDLEFYQTLPVSHTINNTLTIGKKNGALYPHHAPRTWLSDALSKTCLSIESAVVQIEKKIYKKHESVIVLNTLDFLYGHVLLKLYNSIYHLDHQKNLGLVIIIPKIFEWLIPSGCAEAWVVDIKLSDLIYKSSSIQKFVAGEFERFNTIYLSNAYSHPDFTTIDISRLTRTKPFDLSTFTSLEPVITFVLREDRWWFHGHFDYWYYRACRKLGILKAGSRVLAMRQNRLVKKTISLVRKKLPNASFCIVGLGTVGNFYSNAWDERKRSVDDSVERNWCKIYARSHVVIGVHGSNMLLPTAHAAGCVEILPEDRYGNIIQDISVRYTDRKQLYLCRFADQYSSPKAVANKVISIIENFDVFHRNMCLNIYKIQPLKSQDSETIFAPFVDDVHR